MKQKIKLNIEIDNISEANAIAIQDMMATWVNLGNIGSSRWCSLFADGDGNFHPKIKVNGEKAKHAPDYIITEEMRKEIWINNEYAIDSDMIAWRLRDKSLIRDTKIENLNKDATGNKDAV